MRVASLGGTSVAEPFQRVSRRWSSHALGQLRDSAEVGPTRLRCDAPCLEGSLDERQLAGFEIVAPMDRNGSPAGAAGPTLNVSSQSHC